MGIGVGGCGRGWECGAETIHKYTPHQTDTPAHTLTKRKSYKMSIVFITNGEVKGTPNLILGKVLL